MTPNPVKPEPIAERIAQLQSHLKEENPFLLDVVNSFRKLDDIGYATGMLARDQSFTTNVPWWAMIAILGMYSAGKSTFINSYLDQSVQKTGNQAIDDRFTVICYADTENSRELPGIALNADPRFPFYQISHDIEAVAKGEGSRIDTYLQMRTSNSTRLHGKLLIDSPGFDADEQRAATLQIVDHVMGLADLVLVFFDARHPEPGAMQSTLEHLVGGTVHRPDANKFLYILNQIDSAAREDNLEEVFGAWQRALAKHGLTAGRYFQIYDQKAANQFDGEAIRDRYEKMHTKDITALYTRMEEVELNRAYRILALLKETAKSIKDDLIPTITTARRAWQKQVLCFDALLVVIGLALAIRYFTLAELLNLQLAGWEILAIGGVAAFFSYAHTQARAFSAWWQKNKFKKQFTDIQTIDRVTKSFYLSTRLRHRLWRKHPVGWNNKAKRTIDQVLNEADRFIQTLNDTYTNPSGNSSSKQEDTPNYEPPRWMTSALNKPMMVSASALSSLSPTVPTEGSMPASFRRSVYRMDTYWLPRSLG